MEPKKTERKPMTPPLIKLKRVNTVLAGVDLNKNRELIAKLLACRLTFGEIKKLEADIK